MHHIEWGCLDKFDFLSGHYESSLEIGSSVEAEPILLRQSLLADLKI